MCCPISFSRAVSSPAVLMKWSMSFAPLLAPVAAALEAVLGAALAAGFEAGLAAFFFALAYLLSLVTLAMGRSFLSLVAVHVGAADSVLGAGERHHGERGGLHGQRRQIFRLQAVHIGLAAGPGHHLGLDG